MLNVNIMGIDIQNPVVIASGPWSRGIGKLKKALDCGAGAIITETIVGESYPDTCPRYAYSEINKGVQNIKLYSGLELENWLTELDEIHKAKRFGSKTKLIASVMGTTASELSYIAKKVEKTGVDGIEIGLACPMGEGPEIIAGNPDRVYQYTKEVVKSVGVPVSVKLGAAIGNLPAVVNAVERAGADGISAIDTIRCILRIDVETGRPDLPTYGGYSGPPIRPIALSTVAGIVQSANLPVLGIGGIENHINLLEYIMAGATAGGIGTGILLGGYQVVCNVIKDLEAWVKAHKITSMEEIRGISLDNLKSFEEIRIESKKADLMVPCMKEECCKCQSCCLENAIYFDEGNIRVDEEKCTGCGLCLSVCPENKLKFSWKKQ